MRDFCKSLFLFGLFIAAFGVFTTSCNDDTDTPGTVPAASFTFSATELTVAFDNTTTGGSSYSWNFGDGNTSTEQSPSHTYGAGGTYTVVLTATNDNGNNTAQESITVEAASTCETADSDASPSINYTWATDTGDALEQSFFEGFGGYAAERVDNPDQSGVNESCYVMKLTRGTGCETWGGAGTPLSARANFGTQPNTIKLDVWGAATDVSLVFENLPFPDNTPLFGKQVQMTKSNEWETLTFDFSDDASGSDYGNLILYITRDQGGCADEVYYIDNLRQE